MFKTYAEYYNDAKLLYPSSNPKKDVYEFTHEITLPGQKSEIIENITDDFYKLVDKVAGIYSERLSDNDRCYWPPGPDGLKKEDDIVRMCKDIIDVPDIENIVSIIAPQIEKNLYGSYMQVQNIYVYRSPVTKVQPRMSWLWHYDNHPYEYMKCMIYLTDVGENDGPLEMMVHSDTGLGAKHKSYRTSWNNWRAAPNNSRFTEKQIEDLEEQGYEPKKVCGPKGTIIVFNENVVHRANIAKENDRDVINFMIKPSTEKLVPYLNKEYTGTFQNKDMFTDPSHRGLIFK
tara:strand:- start:6603 stop:7466 length:864 start_codon:yes stop_codon:yes gene_type:complete